MHSDFYNISITHHTLPSFLTVRPCHFPAQGPPLLPPPTSHWWHKQGFAQHCPRPSGSPQSSFMSVRGWIFLVCLNHRPEHSALGADWEVPETSQTWAGCAESGATVSIKHLVLLWELQLHP